MLVVSYIGASNLPYGWLEHLSIFSYAVIIPKDALGAIAGRHTHYCFLRPPSVRGKKIGRTNPTSRQKVFFFF
jgi:hypothetical protein